VFDAKTRRSGGILEGHVNWGFGVLDIPYWREGIRMPACHRPINL